MGLEHTNNYLKRRMLTDDGWVYFCRMCGKYIPQSQFYKSSKTPFGIDTKCKLHYSHKKDEKVDKDMDYLKLNPISDEDFIGTQRLLENLGYSFGPNELPIYEQFNIKHGLKEK